MPEDANTHIWYHLYNKYSPDGKNIAFLNTAKQLLVDYFASSNQIQNFEPNTALKVTWENIYPNPVIQAEVSRLN